MCSIFIDPSLGPYGADGSLNLDMLSLLNRLLIDAFQRLNRNISMFSILIDPKILDLMVMMGC